jgi:lysosomal alpha-mannosidase
MSMDQRHKKNVLLLHGDDFWYQQAEVNFRNIDILIDKCNKIQKSNVRLRYSTPLDYYSAIEKENVEWPTLDRDWFPYAMRLNEGWSGFFTSRPSSKKQIKDFSSLYHASTTFFSQIVLR